MNYSNIIQYDCANGEGWRTTLFVSGCSLHCKGCFNEEAQDFNYGEEYDRIDTKNHILKMIEDEKINGLSILGGDPLCQETTGICDLIHLCNSAHRLGKTVWLWSGFTYEDIFYESWLKNDEDNTIKYAREQLIKSVDVFIDGPFIEELKDQSLKWRGSSNQRIIDVKKTLQQGQIVLYNTNLKED